MRRGVVRQSLRTRTQQAAAAALRRLHVVASVLSAIVEPSSTSLRRAGFEATPDTTTPAGAVFSSWSANCVSVRRLANLMFAVVLVAATLVVVTHQAEASSHPDSQTFDHDGLDEVATFVVPSGICFVTIEANGGAGGASPDHAGGTGAHVHARIELPSSVDQLSVLVGGQGGDGSVEVREGDPEAHGGSGGFGGGGGGGLGIVEDADAFAAGGGGGGASAVWITATQQPLVVAAGGGGAGSHGDGGDAAREGEGGSGAGSGDGGTEDGDGGAGGMTGPGNDGAGGGGVGAGGSGRQDGGNGSAGILGGGGGGAGPGMGFPPATPGSDAPGGGGAGDDAGDGDFMSGEGGQGSAGGGNGGDGGTDSSMGGESDPVALGFGGGGGGGGGYAAGGGGGADSTETEEGAGGGGGGGASFVIDGADDVAYASANDGDGEVTISWNPATDGCVSGGSGSSSSSASSVVGTCDATTSAVGVDGDVTVTVIAEGCLLLDLQVRAWTDDDPAPPPGRALPFGLISFRVSGIEAGSTVQVIVDLPGTAREYWKLADGEWFELEAQVSGRQIRFELTDGGPGDASGVADGTIVDPGAPMIPAGFTG